MGADITTNATRPAMRTAPRTLLLGVAAVTAVLMGGVGPSGQWSVAAQSDGPGRVCHTRTLHGDYGLVATGTRGLGPGVSETFATISMVTYDGQGGLTASGVSHGQTTGVTGGGLITGTYWVNPDCTGGQITNLVGAPPIEDRFVIVDNGREVRTAVVSPARTIATANLRKK